MKNSRITPIYEEIPENPSLPNREARPIFSGKERRRLDDFGALRPDRDTYTYSEVPFYEEIPNSWEGVVRKPKDESYDEQELDRTVKWAMENIDFSETGMLLRRI